MTARILPVPLSRPLKTHSLRSGGRLILAVEFDLPGFSKPQPRGAEEGSEGLPDGFADEDFDGSHV